MMWSIRTMANRQNTTRGGALPAVLSDFPALVGSGSEQTITDLILAAEQAVATAEAKAMDRKRRGYPSFWRTDESQAWHNEFCHYTGLVAESYKVPEADGRILCSREKALIGGGWKFVPLPKLVKRTGEDQHRTPLEWDTLAGWLAVPPESSEHAARSFPKKGDAMRWAEARA